MSLLGSKFISFLVSCHVFPCFIFLYLIIWFGYVNYSYFSVSLIILHKPLSVGNTDFKKMSGFEELGTHSQSLGKATCGSAKEENGEES